MRLHRIALFLSLALVPSVASASLLTYTFSGGGLAGSFSVDNPAPFTILTSNSWEQAGVLESPNNIITGSYGGYTFSGTGSLFVRDQYAPAYSGDYWSFRSGTSSATPLSGPEVNGRSVVVLELTQNFQSQLLRELSAAAPTGGGAASYTLGFSDGTSISGTTFFHWASGNLTPPTAVPEPASVILFGVGGLFALGARRRQRGVF